MKGLKFLSNFFQNTVIEKNWCSGIVIEEANKFAYRQGLFVIGQTGETVKILNDKTFKPKYGNNIPTFQCLNVLTP